MIAPWKASCTLLLALLWDLSQMPRSTGQGLRTDTGLKVQGFLRILQKATKLSYLSPSEYPLQRCTDTELADCFECTLTGFAKCIKTPAAQCT